jgi:hypothetical protein
MRVRLQVCRIPSMPNWAPSRRGIARQILQRLGGDGKEQVQCDLKMGTDKAAQLFRHREGQQEVGRGQEQARLLTLQPGGGIGLAAERTVPVVAGMKAVGKAWTVRTLKELAAQCRGAAGQDLLQDLSMPSRHGRAETLPVIGSQTQAAGVDGGEASAMIQGAHRGEHPAHFGGGEDYGEFELRVGPNQFQFVRPLAFEGFLPEDLDGADGLRAGLAGDLLVDFEMDAILTNLLGRDQVRGFANKLAELSDTGVVGLFGTGTNRQQFEVIGEGI